MPTKKCASCSQEVHVDKGDEPVGQAKKTLNKELSEDTKQGNEKEIIICNKARDAGIDANRLSPGGSTMKRLDELMLFYEDNLHCKVVRGVGRHWNTFTIYTMVPKSLWYLICDLHREYGLKERIPNTQEELSMMKQVIESETPEEWIRVPIVGIDIYGEHESLLMIIESKTDKPNAGIQHDIKKNLLTYMALLLLKDHREKKSRKIVVAVVKKTNDLPRHWFAEDQLATFDDVDRLWTP